MSNLQQLREEIDSLDAKIVELLNARANAAVEIGKLKREMGTGVFAPDRERAVLDRIASLSDGPMSRESLLAIYRELMSASFSLERPPRVGYLGPKGSFSHEAAMGKFGASVEYEPLANVRGIFDSLERRHIEYGVVPVENNSTGGVVLDTLDAFIEHEAKVCCEIQRAIHQNLLANCAWDEIEAVYSKPEAFKQCQNWLAETGLASKLVAAASTSKAAETASQTPRAAAVGSALAAKMYGLQILAANIEDNPRNATRFFVIGRESAKPTGCDRTSMMFVTAHQAGALVNVLLAFQKHGVNMSMITSRPCSTTELEYHFFVDIDGHEQEPAIGQALEEARSHCRTFRVLGSYPRAVEVIAA